MSNLNSFLCIYILYLCFSYSPIFLLNRKFPRRMWGPTGKQNQTPIDRPLNSKTVCVTLLTSVDPHTNVVTWNYRETGSNSQVDFLDFIVHCGECGSLRSGDVLVLDNAAVHKGKEIKELLNEYLSLIDVRIIFMPTYSPELNPCELVFGMSKKIVSKLWYTTNKPLIECITNSFALVTREIMQNFYRHCKMMNFRRKTMPTN